MDVKGSSGDTSVNSRVLRQAGQAPPSLISPILACWAGAKGAPSCVDPQEPRGLSKGGHTEKILIKCLTQCLVYNKLQ